MSQYSHFLYYCVRLKCSKIFIKWKFSYIELKDVFARFFFLIKALSATITHCLRCASDSSLTRKSVPLTDILGLFLPVLNFIHPVLDVIKDAR